MHDLAIVAGLFATSVASGFIPIVNAELLVLGAAATVSGPMLFAVVAAATTGQMLAKVIMFVAAGKAGQLPSGKNAERIERLRIKMARHRHAPWITVFASASLGIPPLYLVSLLAGFLRVPIAMFAAAGFAGRAARFGVLALIPGVV